LLNSELILHAHIAPLSYYCVLLCCLEQWVASFDGLWTFFIIIFIHSESAHTQALASYVVTEF